jgi:hypothetical protein
MTGRECFAVLAPLPGFFPRAMVSHHGTIEYKPINQGPTSALLSTGAASLLVGNPSRLQAQRSRAHSASAFSLSVH